MAIFLNQSKRNYLHHLESLKELYKPLVPQLPIHQSMEADMYLTEHYAAQQEKLTNALPLKFSCAAFLGLVGRYMITYWSTGNTATEAEV